jgi:MSHA biogenesis protein MshJ
MIAPEHMAEVIQDVLHQQHGLTLVELHNEPVTPLVASIPSAPEPDPAVTATTDGTEETPPQPVQAVAAVQTGPYVHPLSVVVEGGYVDIVSYLKALETMKWHVYWNRLELETKRYPLNRVRIEMSTLSLDETWLGL